MNLDKPKQQNEENTLGRNETNASPAALYDLSSVESVVATVRAVWQAVESSGNVDRLKLKKDISDTVNQLKSRIHTKLGSSSVIVPPPERLLFDEPFEEKKTYPPDVEARPRFPKPVLRVYGKDLAYHALKHVPRLSRCQSIEDIRKYLTANLRFNSQATRRRNANYLISRFFPGGVVHSDVPAFAAAVEGKPALGDALFYLTGRSEKIVSLVAEEVVFPSLAEGGVSRTRIRDFVKVRANSAADLAGKNDHPQATRR